jgi:chromosome segregation ATPase
MVKQDKDKLIRDLQREIQERALLLSDLEVMIEDYQRERHRLLEELKSLKEGLWDLTASDADYDEDPLAGQASIAAV